MKEHLEPHRTHTAGPRGGTVEAPSDSYFRILDPVSAVGYVKCRLELTLNHLREQGNEV